MYLQQYKLLLCAENVLVRTYHFSPGWWQEKQRRTLNISVYTILFSHPNFHLNKKCIAIMPVIVSVSNTFDTWSSRQNF